MRTLVILTILAFALGGACLAVQGPLPGDVMMTRALQSLFGRSPSWAVWLTDTAKPPLVMATVIVGAGMAWLVVGARTGWRTGLAVPLAFGLAWLIEKMWRTLFFAPRPSSDLVAVASASTSSGLPSTFGLAYGSVFGVVLFAKVGGALAGRALALVLIIAGAAARVVLGGHWTSQMLASIVLGLLAAFVANSVAAWLPLKDYAR